jgi:GT2 family glycosyltransferase
MVLPTVCFSLVLYKHSLDSLRPLLSSIQLLAENASGLRILLCVYDGSPNDYPTPSEEQLKCLLPLVVLSHEKAKNVGFGRANNRNFQRSSVTKADIFCVVNPDIRFSPNNLLPLLYWGLNHTDWACMAPLVLLEDGSIQYSVKRDPTLLSLLIGRFGFLKRFSFIRRYDGWHRNLSRNYITEIIPSSYLSGCFLLIPAWAFISVDGFCDKYFLHVEDADIVRRLSFIGSTLHNPSGVVVHGWARGSHTSISQTFSLIKSYSVYCSIWGLKLL